MECKVKSKVKPDITWFNDKQVVKSTSRIKLFVDEQEDNVYWIRLELSKPELTDAGLYKCSVKNPSGEANANLTLNIECKFITFKRLICKIIYLQFFFFVISDSGNQRKAESNCCA